MKSLIEEQKRMRTLIGFTYEDNSHNVLSEENMKYSNPMFWTYENALTLHKEIISETLSESVYLNEQEEKNDEMNDNEKEDLFMKFIHSLYKNFKGEQEEANQYLSYIYLYFDKLLGGDSEENLNEQYLVDTKWWNWWERRFRKLKRKIKNWNIWDSIGNGVRRFKKYLREVGKKIGRKFKEFSKKVRRHFTKQLKAKWIDGKSIDFGYAHSWKIGKYKPSKSHSMDSTEDFTPNAPEEDWANVLTSKDARKMIKKMSKYSKGKWQMLTSTKGKDEEQKKIDLGFAVASVEYFTKTNPITKWKTVTVGRDTETLLKYFPKEKDGDKDEEKKVFPRVTTQLPKFNSDTNLFADNEWCPQAAGDLFQAIDKQMEDYQKIISVLNPPEGQPKCAVKQIVIVSSCSRYRNAESKTCGTGPLTFEELAQKRLTTMKDYIFQWLEKLGAVKHEDFKEIYKYDGTDIVAEGEGWKFVTEGSNGDGSRGPNPPKNKSFVPVGKGVSMSDNCRFKEGDPDMDGFPDSCIINGKEINRDQAGAPHATSVDYDKYKFVKGIVELVFNDTTPVDPDGDKKEEGGDDKLDVIEVENVSYPISFFAPGKRPFELKFPTLRFNFRKKAKDSGGGGDGKKWGDTKCEAFGG
tara:strand:+ start:1752 stop:3656 length:1905 start_codon:yes stop_codon:yes gene_type:complete